MCVRWSGGLSLREGDHDWFHRFDNRTLYNIVYTVRRSLLLGANVWIVGRWKVIGYGRIFSLTVDKSHEYLYKFKRSCRFYSGSHDPPGVSACNGWAADSGENSKKKYLCNLKLCNKKENKNLLIVVLKSKLEKKILIQSRFFSFHILHLSFGLRDLSGIALPTAHSCFKMHSILLFIYLSIYIYLAIFLYIFLPIVP